LLVSISGPPQKIRCPIYINVQQLRGFLTQDIVQVSMMSWIIDGNGIMRGSNSFNRSRTKADFWSRSSAGWRAVDLHPAVHQMAQQFLFHQLARLTAIWACLLGRIPCTL
jgi:hypothetical protein